MYTSRLIYVNAGRVDAVHLVQLSTGKDTLVSVWMKDGKTHYWTTKEKIIWVLAGTRSFEMSDEQVTTHLRCLLPASMKAWLARWMRQTV